MYTTPLQFKVERDRLTLDHPTLKEPRTDKAGIRTHNCFVWFFLVIFGKASRFQVTDANGKTQIHYVNTNSLRKWRESFFSNIQSANFSDEELKKLIGEDLHKKFTSIEKNKTFTRDPELRALALKLNEIQDRYQKKYHQIIKPATKKENRLDNDAVSKHLERIVLPLNDNRKAEEDEIVNAVKTAVKSSPMLKAIFGEEITIQSISQKFGLLDSAFLSDQEKSLLDQMEREFSSIETQTIELMQEIFNRRPDFKAKFADKSILEIANQEELSPFITDPAQTDLKKQFDSLQTSVDTFIQKYQGSLSQMLNNNERGLKSYWNKIYKGSIDIFHHNFIEVKYS